MLSFTITDRKTIQVDCDDDGLRQLFKTLESVRVNGHAHIGFGGNPLNERSPRGEEAVTEVAIPLGGNESPLVFQAASRRSRQRTIAQEAHSDLTSAGSAWLPAEAATA